jgi:peptidoglycan hydrolase-like protein with peptidoglycan-binding domain
MRSKAKMLMRCAMEGLAVALLFYASVTAGTAAPGQNASATNSTSTPTTASRTKTSTSTSLSKRRAVRKPVKKKTARLRAPTAPTPARISEIQAALASQGSYKGDANGKWDTETVDAMRQFQSSHGLNASGKLDAPTLEKLGLGSDTAGRGAPLPPRVPQASALDNSGLQSNQ